MRAGGCRRRRLACRSSSTPIRSSMCRSPAANTCAAATETALRSWNFVPAKFCFRSLSPGSCRCGTGRTSSAASFSGRSASGSPTLTPLPAGARSGGCFFHTALPPSDTVRKVAGCLAAAPDEARSDLVRALFRMSRAALAEDHAELPGKARITYEKIRLHLEENFGVETDRGAGRAAVRPESRLSFASLRGARRARFFGDAARDPHGVCRDAAARNGASRR